MTVREPVAELHPSFSSPDAIRVTEGSTLQRVADALAAKYGQPFVFTVRDGAFVGDGGEALVFEVRPTQAFGFGKGDPFSQTRWRFEEDDR